MKEQVRSWISMIACAGIAGCSSAPQATTESGFVAANNTEAELLKRLDALEARIAAVHDRIGDTNTLLQSRLQPPPAPATTPVVPAPADRVGDPLAAAPAEENTPRGFIQDSATQQLRESLILVEAKKYSEAIGELSEFMRDHADHPLAETAQFLLGECYFRQGEMQLAREEYQRVLVSYETSSHIPDALSRMAEIGQKSGQTREADQHRETLLSVFPLSPPARNIAKLVPPTQPTVPSSASQTVQETPTADLALPEE